MPPHPHDYPATHRLAGSIGDRWDWLAQPGQRVRHLLAGGGWVEHAAGEPCPDCDDGSLNPPPPGNAVSFGWGLP